MVSQGILNSYAPIQRTLQTIKYVPGYSASRTLLGILMVHSMPLNYLCYLQIVL